MRNLRTILWLLFGIALLAAANVLLSLDGSQKTALVPRASLLSLPDSAVSLLELSRDGRVESVLTRTGKWRIVEPFSGSADEAVVLRLLDALAYAPVMDTLGDQELLKLGRTRADFGLSEPWLRIRARAGKDETAIGFGSLTPTHAGVYAAIEGVAAVFVVPSNTLAAVDVPTRGFRRRALFLSGLESVVSFDVRNGGGEFLSFSRDGDGWQMTHPEKGVASAAKINRLLQGVMGANAVDFVWPGGGSNEVGEASVARLAAYGLDTENSVSLVLKGADGSDRRVSFGNDAKDGLVYALVHNGTAVVTVDRALKDQVSLGNSGFVDTRLFPYEPNQVTGVALVDSGVQCLLAKRDDGRWRMDAPVSAPASEKAVADLLKSVLALRGADADEDGVEVSVAPGTRKVRVSRQSLGPGFRMEQLRSSEMLKVDSEGVMRLTVSRPETNSMTSVVFDRERRAWNVETSPKSGTVSEAAVARVLKAVGSLKAERIVKLKVSADDLSSYGLDSPRLTVAVDLERGDSIRRNVLIGDSAEDGSYATVGASDAVFVLSEEAVADLSAELVGE